MKKFNQFEIGKPVTPSTLVKKEIKKMSMVSVSAGGGMGGSFWKEYGELNGDVTEGGFVTIKDVITKNDKTINTRFVVSVEEVQVLKVVYDTTEWANYNKKTCEKQTQTLYYWFPKGSDIVFGNSYSDNEKLKSHLIKRIIEED